MNYIFLKRFFTILIFTSVLFLSVPVAFAQDQSHERAGEILSEGLVNSKLSEGQKSLPIGNFRTSIIPKAIKLTLALVGTVSVIVFVYAGVMLVIAQGNEEEIKKFKEMITWSLIGLVFIIASYAIVTGVMTLVFK